MKGKIGLILVTVSVALAGCKGGAAAGFDPQQNMVYVKADGSVSSGMVYDMSQGGSEYKEEDLRAFVEELVKSYNQSMGAEPLAENPEGGERLPVSLEVCQIEDGMGQLVFSYASPGDMMAFLETDEKDEANRLDKLAMDVATVETVEGMTLYRISDMTEVEWGDISKESLASLLVKGKGRVQMEKKPLYLGIGASTTAKMAKEDVLELEQGTACLLFKP